jgi:hypothetical protein
MWDKNEHDTFPLLWEMTVRGWTAVGFGQSDLGLRVLGLLVGLGMVAALWWAVRQYGCDAPLVSLVLFAFSPTVFRFGNSLRGYGLGVLLLLLMLGAVWRLVEQPTRRRFLLALAVAMLAVQAMYFNAVLLLALGAGSAAVSLRRRTWKPVAAVVAIGLIAAVSLLPYLDPLSRAKHWNDIQKGDYTFLFILGRFADAVSAAGSWMFWVWGGLLALTLAACCYRLVRSAPAETGKEKDAAVFLGASMLCGTVLYAGVLLSARVPTQDWYYLAIMGFLAVVIEAAVHLLVRRSRNGRIARIVLVLGVAALVSTAARREAHVRMTDVDLIAEYLEKTAAKDDLILISPWQPGVTFTRYYHGQTPWTTLPEMGELPVQRYDIFKQRMGEREPIKPLLQKIAQTLHSGHTLWIVGGLRFLLPTERPSMEPPLPQGRLSEGV